MTEPVLSDVHRTAVLAAAVRALHRIRDADPKILDDPLALALSGWTEHDVREAAADGRLPANTAAWVVRSRIAEDRLRENWSRGVCQYVVLGAGLDTFALRDGARMPGLTVFEVDDPPMQEWKRWKLGQLGLRVPSSLRFVPCDIQASSLSVALAEAGFAPDAPAFVSALGVLQYLEPEAVEATLRWVAALMPGSEAVITYMHRKTVMEDARARAAAAVSAGTGPSRPSSRLARTLHGQHDLRALLTHVGIPNARFVKPEHIDRHYLAGRADGMCASLIERVVVVRPAGLAASLP